MGYDKEQDKLLASLNFNKMYTQPQEFYASQSQRAKLLFVIICTFVLVYLSATSSISGVTSEEKLHGSGPDMNSVKEDKTSSFLRGKEASVNQTPQEEENTEDDYYEKLLKSEEKYKEKKKEYPLIQIAHSQQQKKVEKLQNSMNEKNNVELQKLQQKQPVELTIELEPSSSQSQILNDAVTNAILDIETKEEKQLEEEEIKMFTNETSYFSDVKEKMRSDISKTVNNVNKVKGTGANDDKEVTDEELKNMQEEAINLLEEKEMDKLEKKINTVVEEKEPQMEDTIKTNKEEEVKGNIDQL